MARTTRRRQPPPNLPEFDQNFSVSSQSAFIDKLTVELLGGEFSWPEGGPSLTAYLRDLAHQSPRIFNSPNISMRGERVTLKIAKGWLFSGQLVLWPMKGDMKLSLYLNPTRAARHKGFATSKRYRSLERLRIDQSKYLEASVPSLDNQDNWLHRRMLHTAFQTNWPEFATGHLDMILRAMDRYLNSNNPDEQAGGARPFRFERWQRLVVKQLEIYWEATSRDAITTVNTYGEDLRSRVRDGGGTFYDVSSPSARERNSNAETISLKLADGDIRAVFYAKTPERVRLELRYLKEVRSRAGIEPGQAPLDDIETLPSFLEIAISDAQGRTSRLLEDLFHPEPEALKFRYRLSEFLSGVSVSCKQGGYSVYVVLGLLIRSDGLTVSLKNEKHMNTARNLARRGIVERVRTEQRENNTHRYQVTRHYRAVTRALRELEG